MKFISLCILFISSSIYSQNLQLIDWFAGADMIGVTNTESDLPSDFYVREFELSAFSQIDHLWQGTLTLALHSEPESSEDPHIEIHEAFLFSNQAIEDWSVKIGHFFLGFGRLNRFHRHDWAISEAPLYHEEFFGAESVRDNGVEFSKLLSDSFYLKLTMGVTTGISFKKEHHHEDEEDHDHDDMGAAHIPTHYTRLSSFTEFSNTAGVEYGLNYIGRTDGEGVEFQYAGIDLIYKNRFAQFNKDLLQMEAWYRNTRDEHKADDMGAYLYYERGLNRHNAIGARLDWFSPAAHHHEGEEEHEMPQYYEYAVAYSYYNSEFMRTRFTLSHATGMMIEDKETTNTKAMLQFVFMVGAHPAHVY